MLVITARFCIKDKDLDFSNLPCRHRPGKLHPRKKLLTRNLLSYILGMVPLFYLIPLKSPLACQVHENKMMWGESTYTVC